MSKSTFSIIAMAVSAVMTFHAEAKIPYKNPSGDRFPIVAYYAFPSDTAINAGRFKTLEDAGFTLIMTDYRLKTNYPRVFSALENSGIRTILSVWDLCCSNVMIPSYLEKNKNHEEFAIWFVKDEPTPDEFADVAWRTAEIERLDPSRMTYVNLYPSYGDYNQIGDSYEEYIRKAVNELDLSFLSYDHYPFLANRETESKTGRPAVRLRSDFYSNLEIVRHYADSVGIPFWPFCLASGHGDGVEYYPVPTKGQLSLEAFAALAYGAQGLQYYRISALAMDAGNHYLNLPIMPDGKPDSTWPYISGINNRIQKLAPIFLGNKVKRVWHTDISKNQLPTYFTEISMATLHGEDSAPGLIVSEFTNGSRNFVMIVNKDFEKQRDVTIRHSSNVKRVNENGSFVTDNRTKFTISPGDFILFAR